MGMTWTARSFADQLVTMNADPRPNRDGTWWTARCVHPEHDDDTPSMRFRDGEDALIINCFGCNPNGHKRVWLGQLMQAVELAEPLPPPRPSRRRSNGQGGTRGTRDTEYVYFDADNTPMARKIRYRDPKSFAWQRPYGDTWADGIGAHTSPFDLPLYHLPELLTLPPGSHILLPEGEKDVDRIRASGADATCSPAGSAGPPRDLSPLTGMHVMLLVDNDEAGHKHAMRMGDALEGIAASIGYYTGRVQGRGADISDHLTAGYPITDLLHVDRDGNTLKLRNNNSKSAGNGNNKSRRIITAKASTMTPKRAKWLWEGRIAIGTLGLIAGREGVGKSTFAYWIAAAVTRGTLPGELHGQPATVIVCATEDSWEHTILPRLIAAGADLDLVYRVRTETEQGAGELVLPVDIDGIAQAASDLDAVMLLLDPLTSRLDPKLDSHRDAEVRQGLEPLVAMLERTGLTGVGLMHFNKSGSDDPLQALMASRAFGAVARSVSTVIRDPDDDTGTRRLFGTPKNNLGPDNLPLLAFTLQPFAVSTDDGDNHSARIRFDGQVDATISEMMRRANHDNADRTATTEAADWLSDYLQLKGGGEESANVKRAAASAGHGKDTLNRARQRLGIVSETAAGSFPRRTIWWLPDAKPDRT